MSAFWPFYEVETPRIPYKYREFLVPHHIIPSDDRELQHKGLMVYHTEHHIIPSDDRELQLADGIITSVPIISYQVMTGNYSMRRESHSAGTIISYQVMTGNYSERHEQRIRHGSYHTK